MTNTLEHTIADYLIHCKVNLNLSSKTINAYTIDLGQFSKFCYEQKVVQIEQVDKNVIKKYIEICMESFKISTVKRKMATLKAFFRNHEIEHEHFQSPFRRFKQKLREPKKLPKTLKYSQVEAYLKQLYGKWESTNDDKRILRDILVIEILFQTGMRVSELSNLKLEHINFEDGSILINGKGNKQRYAYIANSRVLKLLQEYLLKFQNSIRECGYLLINNRGKKLSDQSIRNIVKKHNPFYEIVYVTPHVFRHTCASLLLGAGINLRMIQNLLGHASITTTQIYTHVADTEMAKTLKELHPRNRMYQ